tara:strand:+ start:1112 stop:1234 length:123 start_codon:yes stop_codon:yes gene_type:complete
LALYHNDLTNEHIISFALDHNTLIFQKASRKPLRGDYSTL